MHFALQRKMAGCGVGLMVEILNGPINGDDCTSFILCVLQMFDSVRIYACESAMCDLCQLGRCKEIREDRPLALGRTQRRLVANTDRFGST